VFDAFGEPEIAPTFPTESIDPVPQVLAPPQLEDSPYTLQLPLSTNIDQYSEPLDLYLGTIGPLAYTTWRSTSPSTSIAEMITKSRYPAVRQTDEEDPTPSNDRVVLSNFPSNVPHVLVVIDLPPVKEIVGTMRAMSGGTGEDDIVSKDAIVDEGIEQLSTPVMNDAETEIALASIPYDSTSTGLATGEGMDKNIDPDLADLAVPQTLGELDEKEDEKEEGISENTITDLTANPISSMHMDAPKAGPNHVDLGPLPLLLIRRSDGLGFGTGCSIKAKKGGDFGEPQNEWRESLRAG
jgi:hypothetical protein